MERLPDFMIIGAMKCATSTLHKQLAAQPGIFMSEPKEPDFFSDDNVYAQGLKWYSTLFDAAGKNDMVGESSTHYTKLPKYPDAVERMSKCMPEPRLIYVMRHPVERLISHYIHDWSEGEISYGLDEAIDRHPELIDFGRYAYQLEPYFEQFGAKAILPVFLPRLMAKPQAELERICRFVGYERVPRWKDGLEPQNVSKDRIRKFPLYGPLVESSWATWFRHNLVPKSLRRQIRSRFQMRERPALSRNCQRGIEGIFDKELRRLGQWMGADIDCGNFNQITKVGNLGWRESVDQ